MLTKILVEGLTDEKVLEHLFKHHAITGAKLVRKDGIEPLLRELPVYLKASDIESLGIVVDADDDPHGRWQQIRNVLVRHGYTVSPSSNPNGAIVGGGDTMRVGIWMMPDNISSGIIENFLSHLIPEKDDLWHKAREICRDVLEQYGTFGQKDLPKAELHTWLAWQEEPGAPPGLAITKKYFDADSQSAKDFVTWARALCRV